MHALVARQWNNDKNSSLFTLTTTIFKQHTNGQATIFQAFLWIYFCPIVNMGKDDERWRRCRSADWLILLHPIPFERCGPIMQDFPFIFSSPTIVVETSDDNASHIITLMHFSTLISILDHCCCCENNQNAHRSSWWRKLFSQGTEFSWQYDKWERKV